MFETFIVNNFTNKAQITSLEIAFIDIRFSLLLESHPVEEMALSFSGAGLGFLTLDLGTNLQAPSTPPQPPNIQSWSWG